MILGDINPAELSVVVRAFRGSPLDINNSRGLGKDDPAADHWDVTLWTCRDGDINEITAYQIYTSKSDALEQAHRLAKSLGVNVEIW